MLMYLRYNIGLGRYNTLGGWQSLNMDSVGGGYALEIAVISDTHLKNTQKVDNLFSAFENIDLLIHAGDFNEGLILKYLQSHFKFAGVWGNNDDDEIKSLLQEKLVLQIGTYRIGICHGHGKGETTIERAYHYFQNDKVDIVIFGHSHQPTISTKHKVLMLNPGSFTSKRRERWFSYILLTIKEQGFKASLVLEEG